MDPTSLIQQAGPAAATFVVSLAGAVVPFISTEAFLLAVVALAPADGPVWTLAIVAAAGQMAGKSVLYWSADAAARCSRWHGTDHAGLARMRGRLASMSPIVAGGFIFVSAAGGIPPFILVTIIAGAARVRFLPFLAAGLAGRLLRMLSVVSVAAAVRAAG